MKIKKGISHTLVLVVIAFSAQATTTQINQRLSLSGEIGYLSGKSREFVYYSGTGTKLSQLNWYINGETVLKGEANYKITSLLDLNARGWINLGADNAEMDDYDWLALEQRHWSHWSHHKDTNLSQGNNFDFSMRVWFFQRLNLQFGGILGYQRTLFSFLAKGGFFNYDNGTDIGSFPAGLKVIGYQQTYSAPYIGLAGQYFIHKLVFSGLLKFSNFVDAQDVDQHYLRELTFKEQSNNGIFYNFTINAGYYVKPQIKIFAEGDFNYFPKRNAGTAMIDNREGTRVYFDENSAGLANQNMIISLGVQYTS